MYIHTHHIHMFAHSHPCSISIFSLLVCTKGVGWLIEWLTRLFSQNSYTHNMRIYSSFQNVWAANRFPYAPCLYVVPVTAQDNFKHYRQIKNIIEQYYHYISFMDQKSVILSFLLTYVNTTVNNLSITEVNYNTQTQSFISNIVSRTIIILYLKHNNHSSFIYLVYTKHSIHERINSWN
jgi:hypothetical protein